tara:strand:+ start:61 stop:522 length:462 start_codon:yes stop_codon:yes gene_type:complete
MAKKKNKKDEKYAGTEIESGYVKGTPKNLMLDKPMMALPSTHKRVKGKDVPVNKQISDYLKSMRMLERSISLLEKSIESADSALADSDKLLESSIVKKRYKGKVYSTTRKMIEAVELFEKGKIDEEMLNHAASWAEDPGSAISVARMIAGLEQ